MENQIPGFLEHRIDGYSLLSLSDSDLSVIAKGKNERKALSRQLRRLIQIWRKISKQPDLAADILKPTIGAKAVEKLSLSMSMTKRDSRVDSSFEAIEAEVQRRIMRASAHISRPLTSLKGRKRTTSLDVPRFPGLVESDNEISAERDNSPAAKKESNREMIQERLKQSIDINMIDFTQIVLDEPLSAISPERAYPGTWLKIRVAIKLIRNLRDSQIDDIDELAPKLKQTMNLRHPSLVMTMGLTLDQNSNLFSVIE